MQCNYCRNSFSGADLMHCSIVVLEDSAYCWIWLAAAGCSGRGAAPVLPISVKRACRLPHDLEDGRLHGLGWTEGKGEVLEGPTRLRAAVWVVEVT